MTCYALPPGHSRSKVANANHHTEMGWARTVNIEKTRIGSLLVADMQGTCRPFTAPASLLLVVKLYMFVVGYSRFSWPGESFSRMSSSHSRSGDDGSLSGLTGAEECRWSTLQCELLGGTPKARQMREGMPSYMRVWV